MTRGVTDTISINSELLHYLFTKAIHLSRTNPLEGDEADFLLDLTYNISLMGSNEAQLKCNIDSALVDFSVCYR